MSELLDQNKRPEASSVLSTSLVLGLAVGMAQMAILTVSVNSLQICSHKHQLPACYGSKSLNTDARAW